MRFNKFRVANCGNQSIIYKKVQNLFKSLYEIGLQRIMKFIKWFEEVGTGDVAFAFVSGKNASLGEMVRNLTENVVNVPSAFAIAADVENLSTRGGKVRNLIKNAECPKGLDEEIRMEERHDEGVDVAVRGSPTAKDLPTASFARQQETYLNVRGEGELVKIKKVMGCFASLLTNVAILHRDKKSKKNYQAPNETKKLRDEKNPSPPSWISKIDIIIEKMLELQDGDGGFRDTDSGKKGCFSTIEGLYPLLLHPQTERWMKHIIAGINYILENTKDGKIPPTPEYPDIAEDCCVDSMAYGLYVFALARHCIRRDMPESKEKENILSRLDKQIKHCIKYIVDNQNRDGGWPLVKDTSEDIKSRTYSTALVLFALTNCDGEDFKGSNKMGSSLIGDAAKFLMENNNCTKNKDKRVWFFSQPRKRDNDELEKLKKKQSVNLTAVVVFSLSHLLRSEWKLGWDVKISKTIREGARYISQETFKDSGEEIELKVEDDSEPVDYPVYDKNEKIIKIKGYDNNGFKEKEGFVFPYEMILPALVLVPGYSVKSRKLIKLRDHIDEEAKTMRSSITDPLRLFDLSDKIFALEYHYYVEHVVEECLDRYVKRGDVIRCIVDGLDRCYYGRDVLEQKKSKIKKVQKITNGFKDRWRKLADWIKVLIIGSVILVCLLPMCFILKSFFGVLLETNLILGIFWGGVVTVTLSSVVVYYQKKDKTEVKH